MARDADICFSGQCFSPAAPVDQASAGRRDSGTVVHDGPPGNAPFASSAAGLQPRIQHWRPLTVGPARNCSCAITNRWLAVKQVRQVLSKRPHSRARRSEFPSNDGRRVGSAGLSLCNRSGQVS